MAADEDEEALLRSVALQNAQSILVARQRAEEELVRAKDALELRTGELARSLAMMRATLESTTDGILVTDGGGRVTDFNQKYQEMWRLPQELMNSGDHQQLLDVCGRQFADRRQYLARIDDIYSASPSESYDLLELLTAGSSSGFRGSRSSTEGMSAGSGASATSRRAGGPKKSCKSNQNGCGSLFPASAMPSSPPTPKAG